MEVRQRYADGTSSDWIGSAGDRRPASNHASDRPNPVARHRMRPILLLCAVLLLSVRQARTAVKNKNFLTGSKATMRR